jgi:Rad51
LKSAWNRRCVSGHVIAVVNGNIMGHASTYRILPRKAGRDRIAIMIESPFHAYVQTRFMINEGGVQDVGEKRAAKNTEPGW